MISSANHMADTADAGFTLIEMLVTLALTALLATVMIGGIVQMRSMSAISQRNDVNTEFDALGNYLDRLLANAKPFSLIEINPDQMLVLEGAPDHVRFVAVIRIGSDRLGLREVELAARKRDDAFDLIQSSVPRRLTNAATRSTVSASEPALVTGLQSVTFEYFGARSSTPLTQLDWQRVWNETARLPRAIRITVKAQRNRQPVTLERIINLKFAD